MKKLILTLLVAFAIPTFAGNDIIVGFPGGIKYANGQVATSTTAGTLVAARGTRRKVIVKNIDATITVYVGAATVTAGNGFPIKAGEYFTFDTSQLIQVIAASGTPTVAYFEVYD